MTAFPRRRRARPLSDADAARLLHGTPVDDRPDLAGAAAFAAALRSTSQEPPAPSPALAALLAQGFDPATVSPALDGAAGSRRRTLGYGLIRLAGASLAVKVATGGGVALAAVATAGTAGVLPGAVQDRVDSVLEAVTPFDRGADSPLSPQVTPSPTATPTTAPGTRPTTPPATRPTDLPSPARPSGPPSTRPEPSVPPKASPAPQRPTEKPAPSRASARPSPAAERPAPAPQASRRPTEPPRGPEPSAPARQAPAPAQDAPAPLVPRPDSARPDTAPPAERPTR